jgi:hypothetical protein
MREGSPPKRRRGRMERKTVQNVGAFLKGPFFGRSAPHSEAFFTSLIQTVSGIRYKEAFFF